MISTRWRCPALASAAAVLFSACASVPDQEPGDARAAIGRAWTEHIAAAQAKDLDAVMELYAEDVVYAFDGQPDLHGRAALELSERAGLEGADVLEAVHTTLELRVFDDDAFEIGTVVGPVQPRGGEASVVTYRFMAWWVRGADGVWRIRRLAGRT